MPRIKLFSVEIPLFIYVLTVIVFSFHSENYIISYFCGILLGIWFVVDKVIRKEFVFVGFTVYHILFLGFILVCAVNLLIDPFGLERFYTLLQIFILSIIVTDIVIARKGLSAIKYAVIIGCIYACSNVGFGQLQPIYSSQMERVGSTLENPNAFALALIVGMVFLFYEILLEKSRFKRIRNFISIGLMFWFGYYIIYFTGSRKGILLLFILNLMFFAYLLIYSKVRSKALTLLLFPIIESLIILGIYNSPYFNRIRNLFIVLSGGNVLEGSVDVRTAMLGRALDLWAQKPLFGWGIDQFRVVSGFNTYSHNNFSEILVNSGIFGFISYYGIFALLFFRMGKSLKSGKKIVFWSLLGALILIVNDIGMVSYYSKIYWILFSSIIAVLKISQNVEQLSVP